MPVPQEVVTAGEDGSGVSDGAKSDEDDSGGVDSCKSEDDETEEKEKEEEEKKDSPLSLEWPDARCKQAAYLFLLPIILPLWITVPDVRNRVKTQTHF